MLSLFVMYSSDRKRAFGYTDSFLQRMPLYDQCQKVLVLDDCEEPDFENWQKVKVPRQNGLFCWANMWEAGIRASEHEKVVYLDSDRLLPSVFLIRMHEEIQDDVFVFTSRHFLLGSDLQVEKFDPRLAVPFHGPGKNVMSGSVGFTKHTYGLVGGVDPRYCGHGAYADTDFHYAAYRAGCRFVDLQLPELHFPHDKDGLSRNRLKLEALDNFILYCLKWDLPLILVENLAARSGIPSPRIYSNWRITYLRRNR